MAAPPSIDPDVRILVILMGSLGDVARGLAVVDPIRKALPAARISWLVEPACEQLVRLHPAIDSVTVFDRKRPIAALPALVRELRGARYDLVLDLQRHSKSGIFSRLTGAARRIGFHRKNSKEFNWIFQTETIAEFPEDRAKLDHYLTFLDQLGIPYEPDPVFGIAPAAHPALASIRAAAERGKIVGMVLGSSWQSKDWPMNGYERLIDRALSDPLVRVVLIGDRSHIERGEKLATRDRVESWAGKTSLSELLELLSLLDICVGPDSGPGHLSAIVGTPYVSLFGPTSSSRTAPAGSESLAVHGEVGCSPCYRRVCPGLGTLCMRLIGVDAVWERMRPFLA